MKKKHRIHDSRILDTIILILFILFILLFSCTVDSKPNDEVVRVDSTLIHSHPWEECNFCIENVDSMQHSGNYYWFIYNNPDQFDTILCVSTDESTYDKLMKAMYLPEAYDLDRFHLLYGNCEESILLYR